MQKSSAQKKKPVAVNTYIKTEYLKLITFIQQGVRKTKPKTCRRKEIINTNQRLKMRIERTIESQKVFKK